MKDITPILRSLGLLESEIKTYLASLEHGPATVLDLAKYAKLSRQAVYVAIESLTKRGLMSSALSGKKRFYAAEHPDKLLAYAQRRDTEMKEQIKDLERLLPELELQVGGEKPIVKFFEGKEGVRTIIRDIAMSKTQNIDEIADLDALFQAIEKDDLQHMLHMLNKAGTHVRGLYSGIPKGQTVKSDRFALPEKYQGFKSNITLYGKNKLAFIVFTGKMPSIVIESPELAKTFHILFELASECGKNFSKY